MVMQSQLVLPIIELNDSGSISLDQSGIANGVISGATLVPIQSRAGSELRW